MTDGALQGKRAIVSGAASGIGRATALLFAAEGARVALWDRAVKRGEESADAIGEKGGTGFFVEANMTEAESVAEAVERTAARLGGIDVLVNVVGGSGRRWGDGPTDRCTVEGWRKTLDLNLTTVFLGCKFALPHLLARPGNAIVNVSSVLGLVGGDEDFATHAYAASKGGIISLTRAIAATYAPRGLRANVIAPGLIATPMSRRAQESAAIRDRLPELQPLTADFGEAVDVAHAALYLASDGAKFVTGAVLTVDGGWTVR